MLASPACFRERTISLIVVIGILLLTFSVLDNWYRLYVALFPLTVALIAIGGLIPDQPKGYIQRVGLGVLGFALFGSALGNLGNMANDWNYRPILLLIIFAVELNDIFAYICGHLFGHRKFVPNTSPNKTVGGALGAIALTTPLVRSRRAFCLVRHGPRHARAPVGPWHHCQRCRAIRRSDAVVDQT